MTDAERIAELEAKVASLQSQNRILAEMVDRLKAASRPSAAPPGVQRAKARAWRKR